MSEAGVLALVNRYPQPTAVARRVRDGSLFVVLRRLEAAGLVRRHHGQYRLTRRGRNELVMTCALARLVARSVSPRVPPPRRGRPRTRRR